MQSVKSLAQVAEIARTVNLPEQADHGSILRSFTQHFTRVADSISEDEVALFDTVMLAVAQGSSTPDRAALAQTLGPIPNAPRRIVLDLAFDDAIIVAEPVLRASPRLDDESLAKIAATKSQAHLMAIAGRIEVSEPVTDVVVEHGEQHVLTRLARNRGARFSVGGAVKLADKAVDQPELMVAADQRNDLSPAMRAARAARVIVLERTRTLMGRDAAPGSIDHMIESLTDANRLDEALHTIAREVKTPGRVVTRAFAVSPLDGFVMIARASGMGWGATERMLRHRLGANASVAALEKAEQLFDQTSRTDAARTTQILSFKDRALYN
jgi:uncharacterized protein (DUF2336 family)